MFQSHHCTKREGSIVRVRAKIVPSWEGPGTLRRKGIPTRDRDHGEENARDRFDREHDAPRPESEPLSGPLGPGGGRIRVAQDFGVAFAVLRVAVMLPVKHPVHRRGHAKRDRRDPRRDAVRASGAKRSLVDALVEGGKERSGDTAQGDREGQRDHRAVGKPDDPRGAKREGQNLQGEVQGRLQIAACLQRTQSLAVEQGAALEALVHLLSMDRRPG